MANTDLSYYANDVLVAGDPIVLWVEAGDSSILPGYVVEQEDANEVVINGTTTAVPFGIAGLKIDQDVDTAYSEGEAIFIYPIGQGIIVWVKHAGTDETVYGGAPADAGSGTNGAVELFETNFVGDGTTETWLTDTLGGCIGRFMEYLDTEATAKWTKVMLGL